MLSIAASRFFESIGSGSSEANRLTGVVRGQLTCTPAAGDSVISSQVQPSSCITAEVPEISPPPGAERSANTPLERPTGISSLSGLKATCALALGLIEPLSA